MKMRAGWLALILISLLVMGGCGRLRRQQTAAAAQPAAAQQAPAPAAAVPIFCMHDIGADAKNPYSISTKSFGAFIEYLHKSGYQTVSLAQVQAFLAGQGALPAKPVVITFDDGWKSVLTIAKPILDKYQYTATAFLIAQSVGSGAKRLTWADVKALRQAGYEIGSHSLSHAYLTRRIRNETTEAFAKRIRREIAESKRLIEQNLGETITAIAYPYGLYDDFVLQTTQEEGYTVGCTIDRGPADNQSSVLRLPRLMLVNKTTLKAFESMCGMKAMHLSQITPAIGAHVATKSATIAFTLENAAGAAQARVDLAPGKVIKKDIKDSTVSLSVRLNPGANNITVAGGGRIASWLVVCDGG